jgi:hypothetical protein
LSNEVKKMKLSSIIGSAFNAFNKASEIAQNLHLADWLFGFTSGGKDIPPGATAGTKGWFGVLFSGDERGFEVLLAQLDMIKANGRFVVGSYLNWGYPLTGNFFQWLLGSIYRNRFRVFVLNLGSSRGEKIGSLKKKRVWVTPKSKRNVTTEETKDIFSSGSNKSLGMLVEMVDFIEKHGGGEAGFNAYAERAEREGNFTPRVPQNQTKIAVDFRDFLSEVGSDLKYAPAAVKAAIGAAQRVLLPYRNNIRTHIREKHKLIRTGETWRKSLLKLPFRLPFWLILKILKAIGL